jgi:hypothetical protein
MSTETKERDEIDELLLAETDMTEEDLDKIDEELDKTPPIDEVEADEVIPPEEQEDGSLES